MGTLLAPVGSGDDFGWRRFPLMAARALHAMWRLGAEPGRFQAFAALCLRCLVQTSKSLVIGASETNNEMEDDDMGRLGELMALFALERVRALPSHPFVVQALHAGLLGCIV